MLTSFGTLNVRLRFRVSRYRLTMVVACKIRLAASLLVARDATLNPLCGHEHTPKINFTLFAFSFPRKYLMPDWGPLFLRQIFAKVPQLEVLFIFRFALCSSDSTPV
jgi:hypothetical protein